MAKREKYRDEDQEEVYEKPARAAKHRRSEGPPSRGGSWFLSRLAVMLVLLAVLAWFAPAIVASTSLWKSALDYAQPSLADKVEIGRISLGWLSPIELTNVAVRDAKGEPLAEVKSLRSEKSLLDLALKPTSLGKFIVQEPHAKIVVRSSGSNVEDFLALLKLPEPQPPEPGKAVQFALEVTRGRIDLDDQVSGKQWQVEGMNVTADWPAIAGQTRTAKLSAGIKANNPPGQPGEILADLTWTPSPAGLGTGAVQCKLSGLPTALSEVVSRRLGVDVRPAGALSGEVVYRWKDDGQGHHVQLKQLSSPQLAVIAPDYLRSDEIVTAIAGGQGDFEIIGDQIIVRDLKFDSDLLQIAGSGNLRGSGGLPVPINSAAPANELHMAGTIDLARVAAQLPATLNLRSDTKITSGKLQIQLDTQSAGGTQQIRGSLRADALTAEATGRRIAWERPVSLTFALQQTPQGPVIEQLAAEASFLNVRGQGTPQQGSLTAEANLDQLAAELAQFIDLQPNQLAGKLKLSATWQRGEQDRWQATADARIQQFQLQTGGLPWREDDLQLRAEAAGMATVAGLQQLDSASLLLTSGQDRLEAKLTEGIARPTFKSAIPLAYSVKGDLATWLPRGQVFVPLGDWNFAGTFDLAGSGKFSQGLSQIGETKLSVQQFVAASPTLIVQEPVIEAKTSGRWDAATGTFTSPETVVQSSSLALFAEKLQLTSTAQSMNLTGLIEYQGDLARLTSAYRVPRQEKTWQLAGALTGRMEMRYDAGALQAAWTSDIENLTYLSRPPTQHGGAPLVAVPAAASSPWRTEWVEPRVSLQGRGKLDASGNLLEIAKANFTSSALSLEAAGAIKEFATRGLADLQGDIVYDLAGITEKLKPLLGPSLAITGREQRKFFLRGPLFAPAATTPPQVAGLISSELTGEAALGWQSAQYVGLVAGPATVQARLDRGIVQLGPLDVPLSEGRLVAAPRLLLNEPTPLVVMDKGPLVDRVRISPELCHTWLKYVAPLLADVTRAEGKFSVALDGGAVPMFDPNAGNVAGTLNIHAAQVGPGPLATQFLGMANQVKNILRRTNAPPAFDTTGNWVQLPEQGVQFHVVDGRVHHRGLTMLVGDVKVVTQGSVGLDQTIDLVATIPVQESWIAADRRLAGFKGQTIDVPITGTLGQPKFDGKIIQDLGRKLIGNATQNFLQQGLKNELGRGLDRLFGPPPQQ